MARSKSAARTHAADSPQQRRDDAAIARAVSAWFAGSARDLPWRRASRSKGMLRNPYHALVAEIMLQQTQVSRVIEKFNQFVKLFPDVRSLAAASEQDVLSAWTGLGYYRRARNLHAAAKQIVAEFDGRVPGDVKYLLTLKGVGRYTAGAISSIAFGQPSPIVDGNVARVLLRIHGKDGASDDKAIQPWLWERATALVTASPLPAGFNEGLMELGATICLPPPGAPKCGECPLRDRCAAHAQGRELDIPRPKARGIRTRVLCVVARVSGPDGQVLIQQRPAKGMWSNMWQAPTLEVPVDAVDDAALRDAKNSLARAVGLRTDQLKPDGMFEFLATHRHMTFVVYRATTSARFQPSQGEFVTPARIRTLALSTPQRRILIGDSDGGLI